MPKNLTRMALVVEDDAIIRMDAVEIVSGAGFETLDVCAADQALPLLERHGAGLSLLFTDVELPGDMNGFGLARETAHRWPHIGILVASGRVSPRAGELPATAIFIKKPFSADIVQRHISQLERLLGSRRPTDW